MSTERKLSDFAAMLDRLLFSQAAEAYFASNPSYPAETEGPSVAELKITFERLRDLYRPVLKSTLPNNLPWTTINNLFNAAQGAYNNFEQLRNNPAENVFRGFASNLDAFANQTYSAGLPYLAIGGEALEATRSALAAEQANVQQALATLQKHTSEVEQLKLQVQNLVTPAVAGSLSKSFIERRDSLTKDRRIWQGILIVFAIGTVVALAYLGAGIAAALTDNKGLPNVVTVITLRTLFLLPVLAVLAFAFSQYRKERNFEEEYAHKAAVAVTLPSYGNLVPPGEVRDAIMTAAAKVVFTSPLNQATQTESPKDAIKSVTDILDSAGKLLPWKR